MLGDRALFRDSRGSDFSVEQLSPELIREHASELVAAHNQIPFQAWTVSDLLAGGDADRDYLGKWEISTLALSSEGAPLGFCIGFELPADGRYYMRPGVYLHRLAVSSCAQGRTIGALIQAETIARVLSRGLLHIPGPRDLTVFGQTNCGERNRRVLSFHFASGFRVIGLKPYDNRSDVLLEVDGPGFWASQHASLWRKRRLSIPARGAKHAGALGGLDHARVGDIATALSLTKEAIASATSIPVREIREQDQLAELLFAGSLAMMELVVDLEAQLGAELGDKDLGVGTVLSLAESVLRSARRSEERNE